ncbi:uncharacterized protein BT62DRAFT_1010278 [Guyanagaster necrorhizus]|uniref:Uncharacterized protein n=1 Tax=Guyanagaster necrorhizus TaxID=856835 RepID=A0A9P7VLA1_9AGAR|nr:uncharacterized protein BT62DRAFT_1010278 [Guyanagaster necrorhizus MCA 3950]KAG7442643.1 hypothetical protein BT62DRAFT_1010278 [Guyanagaster necrorhizus MCA 3950]
MASSGETSSMRSTNSWLDSADQQDGDLPHPADHPRAEDGPQEQNGMKIPKMIPMPQIAGTKSGTIRIEVPILDRQSPKEAAGTEWNEDPKDDPYEVDRWDSTTNEGESSPDGSLSSKSGSSGSLADDEFPDWTIKARMATQPLPRISNRTLRGFLHRKITSLFLNWDFFEEFRQYAD